MDLIHKDNSSLPLRRQRNQRRLTLEMLSANPPTTAVSAATGRTKKPWTG